MTPIYDAATRLVGFFDGTCLFDLDNEWAGFHDRGHVFAASGRWLGPLHEGSFLDGEGRPVAWLAGSRPTSGMRASSPGNPRRPLPPKRPLRPRTPLPPPAPLPPSGGWSASSWGQWLGTAVPAGAAAVDVSSLVIEAVALGHLEALSRHVEALVAANGRDGAWIQPTAPGDAQAAPALVEAIRDGAGRAPGEPGWRRAWIARDASGQVLGHVDLRAHPEPFAGHRCQLGLGVRADARRLGLATKLLAYAAGWASEQGLRWIDLRVLSANEPAVAFYRREGFQMQGGRPDLYVIAGVSLGEVWMARRLSAAR